MSTKSVAPSTLELLGPNGSIPLGYAQEGAKVYLIARERTAFWPVAVLRTGRVQLRFGGRLEEGSVQLIPRGSEWGPILSLFQQKYGMDAFRRWYSDPARIIRVELAGPQEDPSRIYGQWLESEFDNVAEAYDQHILGNRMNRLLRDRSLARLIPLFRGSRSLLEIGCGSGMETLPLLREGHELLCLDISQRMLDVVREKARVEGLQERLRTAKLRARELPKLLETAGAEAFDGGFSTYGALNCEPDLRPVPTALRSLLRPGSAFLAGVYNRWCLFELVGYGLSLQRSRVLSRWHRPILVGASRFCVDVYSYTPADLVHLFSPGFHVESLEAVPIFLPPSDLSKYAERFSRHFDLLSRLDFYLGSHWPWRYFGDHFLMTLRWDADESGKGARANLSARGKP